MDKRSLVSSLLADYFSAVCGPGDPNSTEACSIFSITDVSLRNKVDVDAFFKKLAILGAYDDDKFKSLSHEDILECLPEFNGIKPKILAKDIAKIFRGSPESSAGEVVPHVSEKRAFRMSPGELVAAFDPENHTNSVGKRLTELAGKQPFIVYLTGRRVDVGTTAKLLSEAKAGFPAVRVINVGNDVKKVYAIGELPDNYVSENPLYPGRPLRPDDVCDQLGRSWEGVSSEVRQFVRIMVDTYGVFSHDKANDILDFAVQADAMGILRKRYRDISVRFDELAGLGSLPKLRVVLGAKQHNVALNVGQKVEPGANRTGPTDHRGVQGPTGHRGAQGSVGPEYPVFTTSDDTNLAWAMWYNQSELKRRGQ